MSTPYVASSWKDVPAIIDGRAAEIVIVSHGLARSLSGNDLLVDFGNELGSISMARLTFRDGTLAHRAYCKGIRLELRVVEDPETPARQYTKGLMIKGRSLRFCTKAVMSLLQQIADAPTVEAADWLLEQAIKAGDIVVDPQPQ